MHVDRDREAHRAVDDRPAHQLGPPRTPARAEHELRAVLGACELGERRGDVAGDDLVVLAAEVGEQLSGAAARFSERGPASPSAVVTWRPSSSPCARCAMRAARRINASVPGAPVIATSTRSRVSHGSVMPWRSRYSSSASSTRSATHKQRELAQRREVAGPEVVRRARRRSSPACRCCRAPCAAGALRASCRRARSGRPCRTIASGIVSRCATPVMRSTTSFTDSRCWMLSVEMTSMPAFEQLFDVLPPLLVARSRARSCARARRRAPRVGLAGQDRVDVHLLECAFPILEAAARHDLEVGDLLRGLCAAVRLDEPDDDVGAAVVAPAALVQHGERLADTGRGTEVDAQRASGHGPSVACEQASGREAAVRKPLRRTGNALSPR